VKKLVGILVITAVVTVCTAANADGNPPRELSLRGDHWTAWEPPPSEEGAEIYLIQRGDTLWDLAARFFGDAYLWPQLWERNTYILDAHWIYPGDPLVLPGVAVEDQLGDAGLAQPPIDSDAAMAAALPDDGSDDQEKTKLDRGRASMAGSAGPIPLGHESDIYCSGYIGEVDESFALTVVGSENDYLNPPLEPGKLSNIEGIFGKAETAKFELSIGDIVYLDGGRNDGLTPGALYTAIEAQRLVRHPVSNELLGRYYKYLGRVRVLSAQADLAIAEVIFACQGVTVGSKLKPFEPEPVPLRRLSAIRPLNFPEADEDVVAGARIVFTDQELVALGTGHLVYIDRGVEQDVAPGDIFTVYRRTEPGVPPIVLGEVGVLSVGQNTALARILASRFTVYIGDALLPK
jgi:hypothetical protein